MTSGGALLVVSPRIVGHFTVYAADCMDAALKQGMKAIFLGYDFRRTHLFRQFNGRDGVIFQDMAELCPDLAPPSRLHNDAAVVNHLFSKPNIRLQAETIRRVQEDHGISATLLLNSDDMLFRSDIFMEQNVFAAPTFGVFTFGYRNRYAGFRDWYTERFERMQRGPSSLAGAFTLDEYHVQSDDPEQKFLRFFPDPYRNFNPMPVDELPAEDRAALDRLNTFLASDDRPLIPIIGKLDHRKNVDWILEMGTIHPDLTFAVLGERIPGPNDARINQLLADLETEDRVFVHNRFTPEHLFDPVLADPRTAFLPLAYGGHYGSSAIQLHGLRRNVPCLIPDIGLMAFRTADHGLGGMYRHADKTDFQKQFSAMLSCARLPDDRPRFTDHFSEDRLAAALECMFRPELPRPQPPQPEAEGTTGVYPVPASFALCRRGLDHLASGRCSEATENFRKSLELDPGHPVPAFRLGLAECFSGKTREGIARLKKLRDTDPGNPELRFLTDSMADSARSLHRIRTTEAAPTELDMPGNPLAPVLQNPENQDDFLTALDFVLALAPDNMNALHLKAVVYKETERPAEAMAILEQLVKHTSADTKHHLQTKGVIHAWQKEYEEAARCFRRALDLDGKWHELRLNLSDTLRYAGLLNEAMDTLTELEHADPDFPGLHLKKAQVLFEAGDCEAARKEFRTEKSNMIREPFFIEFSEKLRSAPEKTGSKRQAEKAQPAATAKEAV